MISTLSKIFKQLTEGSDLSSGESTNPNLAVTSLFVEVSGADHHMDESEEKATLSMLKKVLEVDEAEAKALLEQATNLSKEASSLYEFTSQLRHLDQPERIAVIKALWEVAYADKHLDPLEESVIRKAAELLYVDHKDFIKTKLEVTGDR
ncbi:TerB family tellurite resistance protein [Vibrio sp. S9_S30]|uniref:tellurite resistance TerB family protein n=1 Tax=Vibrio sp. S9_S30 TaxID=2720226 RepID=UPI0016803E8D|nr:TerB family tellurite resistance protein [Vibrio sp. S9_S30]MBD1558803.1 TerB family tellurite resistance protein [Vibrio sp. S9_S30]